MLRLASICVIFAAWAGCAGDDGGPSPQTTCDGAGTYTPWTRTLSFAELPMVRPEVNTALFPKVYVSMTFGERFLSGKPVAITDDGPAYCPVMDDEFTATLAGATGAMVSGGWVCAGPGGMACTTPTATFDNVARAANAEIVVSDSQEMLTMPLGDALVQRTMERVDQPDWTLQVGQNVSIRWTPSTDLADLKVNVSYTVANVTPSAGWGVDPAGITITGDTINFTVPDASPKGPGSLRISVEGIRTYPTHTVNLAPLIIQSATYVP